MPVIGTNEVREVGMGITLMTPNASLRMGQYLDTIQWDTMRKTPTWWTNTFEAGEEYGEGASTQVTTRMCMSLQPQQPADGSHGSC